MNERCPRPDKEAFDSEEAAGRRYTSILHTDPGFAIYQCVCRKYHGGHHRKNSEAHAAAMASVPMIRTGLNPAPTVARPQRRRTAERRASSEVRVTVPHPLAWQAALLAADGDARRLEVIDEWHIDIHNDPEWRKRG